jgi:cyclopropane-fatty-acyl-phospholipid synthase
MQATREPNPGASAAAIRRHYDVGNDFYRLWLDPTLSYSCALWDEREGDDGLETAQLRKIDYHIDGARARGADRVLDVGCGWGAALRRLVDAGARRAVGLTLSQQQADWVGAWRDPRIEVRLEGWLDHAPARPYDAVLSVGAFEHFARADMPDVDKVAAYRAFFLRCYDWLKPGGWLSLQTIAYGNLSREEVRRSTTVSLFGEVFPESDLPTPGNIFQACDGLFEPVTLRNDRLDYHRTCRVWAERLAARREEAVALVGKEVFTRYSRYLKVSAALFHYGYTYLLRIAFRRLEARCALHGMMAASAEEMPAGNRPPG